MRTLTAVLFAGGESRRMGADKAVLGIGGEPLWSRQLRVLRGLNPERLLVSARSRPAWCPPEMEVVPDREPSHGPLSGLAAVLAALETSHALVLALDLPLIETVFLRELWGEAAPGTGVVPANGDLLEPLCAVYPKLAAAAVDAALNGGNFSLQNVLAVLRERQLMRVMPVAPSARPAFLNLNSPADLWELKSRLKISTAG